MYAIISDVHGNVEALNAVLASAEAEGADQVICLGDLVGYGPDSIECVRRASAWRAVVAGDWDLAVIEHNPQEWSAVLSEQIQWLRQQFLQSERGRELLEGMTSYLKSFDLAGSKLIHAAPGDVRDFIFPEDIYDPEKLNRIASKFEHTCFAGHTHIPGLFRSGDSGWTDTPACEASNCRIETNRKTICNVGSVGQPRDGDPRASYVLFDGRQFRFLRVEYDVERTLSKIRQIDGIDDIQGERLLEGR